MRQEFKKETRELAPLMSELGRLTSPRSSTPRSRGLSIVYTRLSLYARRHNLPQQEFCDKAMLVFLETQNRELAA